MDEYYAPINNLGTLKTAVEAGTKSDPAQMASILAVLQAVSAGTLEASGAEALILATYPNMDPAAVEAMVEGAESAAEEAAETPGQEAEEDAEEAAVIGAAEKDAAGRSLRGSPDQPRDEGGRWTSGGGGSGGSGDAGGSSGGGSVGGGGGPAHVEGSAAYAAREAHREGRNVADYTPANPDAVETNQRFKTSDGSYTPARAAMHDEVVADALAGVPKSENPTLYMMGGGPAAGKSSIINSGAVTHPENHVMANPDVFKEDIPEYRAGLASGNLEAAAQAHEESSDLNVRVMSAAAAGGRDTVWDGTGDSSIEKLQEKVDTFKSKGFTIQADYVTCDTEAAVARATARAAKTGRQVPEKDIRDTHAKVSKIWPEAVRRGLFDRSTLYDTNAGGKPVAIASAKGTSLTIHDQAAYGRFLAKAGG